MANIGEKVISICVGNLNSGLSYLITAVSEMIFFKASLLFESNLKIYLLQIGLK